MVKKAVKTILIILAVLLLILVLFLGYLILTEYKPEDVEPVEIVLAGSGAAGGAGATGTQLPLMKVGETYRLLSWNIGYCGLGDNSDFVVDGGTMVMTADEERTRENMKNIMNELQTENADIMLIQEIDIDSRRTYHINQVQEITDSFPGTQYTFAYNYNCKFIPYPWPPLGKMESGIVTMSRYQIESANRVQLPIAFPWPVSIANLKRCLTVHHIPLEGQDGKELVLVNLHLEAYDKGEGKVLQTQLLKEVIETEFDKGNYVIAGGDFNQIFSSVDGSKFPQQEGTWECGEINVSEFGVETVGLDDPGAEVAWEWKFLMDEDIPSCRSLDKPYENADKETFQYYIIDGLILSPNVDFLSYEVKDFDFRWSDHNPIIMEFKLI